MAEILQIPEDIRDKQAVGGVAYLRGITISTAKNGNKYASGTVATKKGTYTFKKWGTDTLEVGIYLIEGHWQVYNGQGGMIIDTVTPIQEEEGGFIKADFLQSRYNRNEIFDSLKRLIIDNTSESGYKLYKMLLTGRNGQDAKMVTDFAKEFAAINHHDNVLHGLLAHSYKVAKILVDVIKDPLRVYKTMPQDFKDIVIVGGALHDLGKVLEYSDGEISKMGRFISHRTFAIMRAEDLKDDIVSLYGEEGYIKLQSIFAQHHGQYEESPRTVEAWLVHKADAFDADITTLDEGIQKLQAGDESFRVDGFKLSM